ncbi:MAG: hypothetical protein Q8877_03030, partial [Sweet potato little leaf phytoplasma]|nr:hypothetical protein [Sweet potato little leaf phytoplasma]
GHEDFVNVEPLAVQPPQNLDEWRERKIAYKVAELYEREKASTRDYQPGCPLLGMRYEDLTRNLNFSSSNYDAMCALFSSANMVPKLLTNPDEHTMPPDIADNP